VISPDNFRIIMHDRFWHYVNHTGLSDVLYDFIVIFHSIYELETFAHRMYDSGLTLSKVDF